MRCPGTAPLFLLWLSNPVRIVKEATPAALGSRPAPVRHHLCLPRSSTAVLGAGGERGHRSGAARTAPVPGTPFSSPAPGHRLPRAGSRRSTPHLVFVVKISLEERRSGRCRGVCALCQHAARHGHAAVAAQGGERNRAALLSLTQARQRVRTEREEEPQVFTCGSAQPSDLHRAAILRPASSARSLQEPPRWSLGRSPHPITN